MTVGFLGAIREITGVREQQTRADSIRELLDSLLDTYTHPWKEHVYDGQDLTSGVVVMVNGQNIQRIEGLSTPLARGDRVDIFPMFEGG